MSKAMLKTVVAVLLTASVHVGAANAHGGGPAETMPAISFTEMPAYRPALICRLRHTCRHARRYGPVRSN